MSETPALMTDQTGRTVQTPSSVSPRRARALVISSLALAAASWWIVLAVFNTADGDLWAKLAIGAYSFQNHSLPAKDFFAFTPVLPNYVDHEWGAGLVFYALVYWLGPGSLMVLKLLLGTMALMIALVTARKAGTDWNLLLLLLVPAAACVLPGYVPVIRSHTFTYVCFALTLWLLEQMDQPSIWPVLVLGILMAAWVNLHGGMVAGLAIIASFVVFHWKRPGPLRRGVAAAVLCGLATLANPWGIGYWRVLIAALLHPRTAIPEWQPLSLWALDAFTGFRVLFAIVLCAVILSWRSSRRSSWQLFILAITAFLAWRSRRHAPFFGIAALSYSGPYLAAAFERLTPRKLHSSLIPGFIACLVAAVLATHRLLPHASLQTLAPVGEYPVREADILSLAKAKGNAAVPFHWGSYVAWRLYPSIRISFDGRYEAAYPESTFAMNEDFFNRKGNWTRLIDQFPVDFVFLDLHTQRLRPDDLGPFGYALIWQLPGFSALMARTNYVPSLSSIAATLPERTIEPLDCRIPSRWLTNAPRETNSDSHRARTFTD